MALALNSRIALPVGRCLFSELHSYLKIDDDQRYARPRDRLVQVLFVNGLAFPGLRYGGEFYVVNYHLIISRGYGDKNPGG